MTAARNKKSEAATMRDGVLKKIRTQFDDSPDQKLMFAVVEQAIKDLSDKSESIRHSAKRYLNGGIQHAEICGVDSEWIQRVLRKCEMI